MYITIQDIVAKYKFDLNGVIHLGAHLGEESKDYAAAGCDKVIWIEGNPSLIDDLKSNLAKYPDNTVFNILISDKDNTEVIFNITEFSQSSSILELGITKEIHNTKVIERKMLKARRIDSFFTESKVDIRPYNFLNIDLQGYELTALKSMGDMLDNIEWVYTEVNDRPLYKKCTLMDELDLFLLKKGFRRVELYMTGWHWGDALYQRRKIGALEYAGATLGILGWSIRNRILGSLTDRLKKSRMFLGKIKRRILGKA
jgi:FkbM family methyltransferase